MLFFLSTFQAPKKGVKPAAAAKKKPVLTHMIRLHVLTTRAREIARFSDNLVTFVGEGS